MQQMKNVMHSAARCLAITFSLIFTIPTLAQEQRYISGAGVVRDSRGRIDIGGSIEEAKRNLFAKILEESGKNVVTHETLTNRNGKHNYESVTAVDSGVRVREEDIQYIPYEGFWMARIERSKVFPQEVTWKEEHITINNTYNAPTTYSRGYRVNSSTTRTTRRVNIVGPSGRVVRTTPGTGSTTKRQGRWNGRYGSTWEITRNDR